MAQRSEHEVGSESFRFALVADPHLAEGLGVERFRRLARTLAQRGDIAFVLVLGDLVWHGPIAALLEVLAQVEVPCHVLYGNNDADRLDEYEAALGPRDRTVRYGSCALVLFWDCLPKEAPHNHRGALTEAQWLWLEGQLAQARRGGARHLFLAAHIPPDCPSGYHQDLYLEASDERRLWSVCRHHGVDAAFFGHIHQSATFQRNGTEVIVAPSLNWNFGLPPGHIAPKIKVPLGEPYIKIEEGGWVLVQVHPQGVTHTLVPLEP